MKSTLQNSLLTWLPTAGLFLLLTMAAAARGAEELPSTAPDFTLKADSGKNMRLHELRGTVVMINFWATWCGPCREEMPKLEELHRQYHKAGFTLLGVNLDDTPGNAIDMAKKLGVSFPILFDKDKQVSKLYRVSAMPMTVLIDRDGKIRYLHRGYKAGYETTYQTQVRELLKE